MKVVKHAFLGALVLGGLCAVAAPASADYRYYGYGHNRQELRSDRGELFRDRQELRRDLRNGASRAEIAQDRREIFQDRRELGHDFGNRGYWGWHR
jgi:hypothetical protein